MKKGKFVSSGKITYGGFSGPIEGRRKSFYSEIWGNAVRVSRVRGELVKISWGSPCVTVLQKLLNTFE